MIQNKNNCKPIPALDRGLAVLEHMLLQAKPQRYIDIKRIFPGITDATINRLLKALIASGYVKKTESRGYDITEKLLDWGRLLNNSLNVNRLLPFFIHKMSVSLDCSASFITIKKDCLEFANTSNIQNGINLADTGDMLYYEVDHAACLAIIDNVDKTYVDHTFNVWNSRITGHEMIQKALSTFRKDGYYIDESVRRRGVSRMAVFIEHELLTGALFIGLTTTELEMREDELASKLLIFKSELYDVLNQRVGGSYHHDE